jgi:hypothetical protein
MFLFNVTYALRCLRVPQVEYHCSRRPLWYCSLASVCWCLLHTHPEVVQNPVYIMRTFLCDMWHNNVLRYSTSLETNEELSRLYSYTTVLRIYVKVGSPTVLTRLLGLHEANFSSNTTKNKLRFHYRYHMTVQFLTFVGPRHRSKYRSMSPIKVPFWHLCGDQWGKTPKYRKKTLEIEPGGVVRHVVSSG